MKVSYCLAVPWRRQSSGSLEVDRAFSLTTEDDLASPFVVQDLPENGLRRPDPTGRGESLFVRLGDPPGGLFHTRRGGVRQRIRNRRKSFSEGLPTQGDWVGARLFLFRSVWVEHRLQNRVQGKAPRASFCPDQEPSFSRIVGLFAGIYRGIAEGTSCHSNSRFRKVHRSLFPSIPGKEGLRQVKAGLGFEISEQFCQCAAFQNGKLGNYHVHRKKGSVACLHRPIQRLLPCTSVFQPSEVSAVCTRESTLPVHMPSLWT